MIESEPPSEPDQTPRINLTADGDEPDAPLPGGARSGDEAPQEPVVVVDAEPAVVNPPGPIVVSTAEVSGENQDDEDKGPNSVERPEGQDIVELSPESMPPSIGESERPDEITATIRGQHDESLEATRSDVASSQRSLEVVGEPPAIGIPGLAGVVRATMPLASGGRPDIAADAYEITDGLSVVAASVRGRLHRADDTPRQDDYAIRLTPDRAWLVCAVADGVSSGALSHVAARIAAHHGASMILRMLEESSHAESERVDGSLGDPTRIVDSVDFGLVFKGVSEAIINAARKHSVDEATAPELARVMSTTAAYVIMGTVPLDKVLHGVFSSVGDTSVWRLDGSDWQSLTELKHAQGESSDGGPASDRVPALPYYPAAPRVESFELPLGQTCLIFSDGIGDPLFDGSGDVGETFASWWHSRPSPQMLALQADFRRKSYDDDRTVVGIWTGGAVDDVR